MTVKQPYLEVGRAVNTHGVRGDLKLECWCDSPAVLAGLKTLYLKSGADYRPFTVTHASVQKEHVLVHLEGLDTFEAVIGYKNRVFFCQREDIALGEGDHFIADLIGLDVKDAATGEVYGTLKDVIQNGSGDLYEIERPDGSLSYMPAVDEFVRSVDPDTAILVSPIEGMF